MRCLDWLDHDETRDSDTTMKTEDNLKLEGPYETSIAVHITDGEREGKITINLTLGTPPTRQEIAECVAKAKETAEENGFRLMSKMEFFNAMMRERLGATENFACPGGTEWDTAGGSNAGAHAP